MKTELEGLMPIRAAEAGEATAALRQRKTN